DGASICSSSGSSSANHRLPLHSQHSRCCFGARLRNRRWPDLLQVGCGGDRGGSGKQKTGRGGCQRTFSAPFNSGSTNTVKRRRAPSRVLCPSKNTPRWAGPRGEGTIDSRGLAVLGAEVIIQLLLL